MAVNLFNRPETMPTSFKDTALLKGALVTLTILLVGKNSLGALFPLFEWLPLVVAACMLLYGIGVVIANGRLRVNRLAISYLWFLGIAVLVSLLRTPDPILALQAAFFGTFTLAFFLVFWIVMFNVSSALTLDWFLRLNVYVSLVVSILGIYQVFVDHSLFGTVTTVYGLMESNVTRRAVSLFGSPQTLGIYLALVVAYLYTIKKTPFYWLILLIDMFVMLLTGNQSVFVFFVVFFATYAMVDRRAWSNFLLLPLGLIAFYLIGGDTGLLQRMIQPLGFLYADQSNARVEIWARLISAAENPFELLLGHGVGMAERLVFNRFQYGSDSAESYLLKLFHEVGLVGTIWFGAVYTSAVRQAHKNNKRLVPIFLAFLTNLIFVHAYSGTFMSFFFSAVICKCLTSSPDNDRDPKSPDMGG